LAMADPAASISRGDFYVLLMRQLDRHNVLAKRPPGPTQPLDITKIGAYKLLSRVKAVDAKAFDISSEEALSEHLSRPIWPKEAFEVVARLVEVKGNFKRLPPQLVEQTARSFKGGSVINRKDSEVGGWLGQPAFAERGPAAPGAPGTRPLSYLDAAQIALDSVSGLK